ncbi:hypothetical protein Tco_1555929 [Tanacetum coccineum]
MSELLDDAIGVYHRMFDFSGVHIPFSSFLLALIKHYKVHFSHLGPLGLNKVVTFEVLCRSLQIESTVTLFRVFQTLCNQGHWFSFAKRHAPSPRHPDSAINGPRPPDGSFNMEDVRRLSVHVVKLKDMPEGVLVLSGLSHVWKSQTCDLANTSKASLPIVADVVMPDPTLKDVAASNPSAKVVAKAEASQKQKTCTSNAASSHVAKRTRSTMAQVSSSTTRPNLFADDSDAECDDDNDSCYEILLVTPIHSATVIPSSGNQDGGSASPNAEGPNTRDSRGKSIITDADVAPPACASRPRSSSGPASSFRDVSGDTIHREFFPFSPGPYYATYHEGGIAENFCFSLIRQVTGLNDKLSASDAAFIKSKAKVKERKKKIKSLTKSLDNLHAEVARLLADLNQATILEAKRDEEILCLKATPPEVQAELLSLAASARFERGLSMHQTKEEFAVVLGKISQFVLGAQGRLTEASFLVAQTDYAFLNKISEHAAEPLSVILQLEPKKLTRPANIPALRDTRVSPPLVKESTVTRISESFELPSNVVPSSSTAALEPNEEWVNAMVDGSDHEMTDDIVNAKSGSMFVQGASYVVDDDTKLTVIGSERISSDPSNVVMALSVGEKGDGYVPTSTVNEEAAATPYRV